MKTACRSLRWAARLALAALGACGLPAGGLALDLMPHSVSRSGRFAVYARESALRGAVGSVADDLREKLNRALGLPDEQGLPIVIDLRAPDPGQVDARLPVRLRLAQTGLGLKVELDLLTGEAGRGTRLHDELVRALLLELEYRDKSGLAAGQGYAPPPPWLVEGFSAYLESLEDGVSARLFAALLPTAQALPISEFLERDPAAMDSASRGVYRAYAYDLVCLLARDLENGRTGMLSFIRALPGLAPEEARHAGVLAQHFPALAGSPDALEKWWVLGLARLSAADRYQALSVADTEARLQALLTFEGPAGGRAAGAAKTYAVADFAEYLPLKGGRQALQGVRAGLAELSGRANPLTQTIVAGYQAVVEALIHKHAKGAGETLRQLAAARQEVLKRQERIVDYDNWFEATQLTDQSGAFETYFQAARELDRARARHRPDAISTYLDEVDAELR